MKKSMSDYLCALSENNYDILYDIMSVKYRKFIRIYWLLKDYSDIITGLSYKEKSNKDVLKISVSVNPDVDIADLASNLRLSVLSDEDDDIKIVIDECDESMMITLHKSEVDE